MQLTSALAALLLAGSAFVSAAPTASPIQDVTLANGAEVLHTLEARLAVCNPPKETDPDKLKKQNDFLAKMRTATAAAHAAEDSCPASKMARFESIKKSQKKQAQELKDDCITAYGKCVTQRKAANNACKQAGGTVDKGHKDAVTHCQDEKKKWQAKVVPK